MTEAAGIITQSAHRRLANKAAGMVKQVDDAAQELKADIGAKVDLNIVLEGIIPIKIPCLDIEGLHIGSW